MHSLLSILRSSVRHAIIPMALLFLAPTGPAAAQSESQPSLLQQYNDWGAYSGSNGNNKVCFALSQPASSETDPPNRARGDIYLFVSTRPADRVRNEISVIIGYPFRAGSEATVTVGSAKFSLQTQGDNAWVKTPAEEAQLVDAMRRGSDMVVTGVSSRGTATTDRYSLSGITAALDRVAQECP